MICFKYLTAIFLVALIVGCSGAARGVPTEPGCPSPNMGPPRPKRRSCTRQGLRQARQRRRLIRPQNLR